MAGALKKSEIRDIASKVLAALPRDVLASFAVDLLEVAGEAQPDHFFSHGTMIRRACCRHSAVGE